MIDFDTIINEWSYRARRGYPVWNDPQDMIILKDILKEMNLSLDNIQLNESEFTPAELVRDKYFNGFIDKWNTEDEYLKWCYKWIDLCIDKMMLLAAELRGIYPKSFNCFC